MLAGLLGPPILTFVGDLYSWRAAFALVGGFAVLAAVSVRITVPDVAGKDTPRRSVRDGFETYRVLLTTRPVLMIYLATVLQMGALIGAMVYVGAYLVTDIGMTVRYVGFAFAAQSIGGLAGSLLAGRVSERMSLRVYMLAVSALSLALFGIYTLTLSVPVILVLLTVTGLSQVTAWVTLIGVLSRTTPVGQGSTMVLNGSMLGVGGAIGSALGGTIIALTGYSVLGIAFALAAVASGIMLWTAVGRSSESQS